MDPQRFDDLVRHLPLRPRRDVLTGLAGGVLAMLPSASVREAEAKKNKNRKKPLKRNDFGCVDVGKACRGNDNNCCSGVCDGKKPKKGDRDKSTCVAHDASTCVAGQTVAACDGVTVECATTSGEGDGQCVTTTGKAPYCFGAARCFACKKDADCVAVCGAGAACFPCAAECGDTVGTACGGIASCGD